MSEEAASTRTISVLLVDDEATLLKLTARILRNAGCVVTTCATGTEAAQRLASETFDVVVSDLQMPGLSGIELLRLLRDRDLDVPVILVTGAPTLDSAMKAVEYGAFKYLAKPVARDELIAAVKRAAQGGSGSGAHRRSHSGLASALDRASMVGGTVLAERYRLERLIGSGGMSQVWEATHLLTTRPVAVKVLHASLNARPEMRVRMLREARASTSFAHPNVCEVLDVLELADATPVIVMELLRGRTLRERLDESGRLGLAAAADVLLPVASALGTAHAHGVVHRDVKPENVFLCEDTGLVKMLDFGVAKLVYADAREATGATKTGAFIGTVGYMAPEQAFGEKGIDHRADVWSFGALIYETLSGARAVPGATVGQVLQRMLTEKIEPLDQRVPGLPTSLVELVHRMLAEDPAHRPTDLREAYDELARYASVSAPPFGPPAPAASRPQVLGAYAPTELPPEVVQRGARRG